MISYKQKVILFFSLFFFILSFPVFYAFFYEWSSSKNDFMIHETKCSSCDD